MNSLQQVLNKLPEHIRSPIMELPQPVRDNLEEIRVRAWGDVRVLSENRELVVALKHSAQVTGEDLNDILNNLLDYSYYAYEHELAKGYITIEGGHRVGVCGRAVLDQGRVTLIKDVSSLNLRRSRAVAGAAREVLSHVLDKKDGLQNTLILSPPKCGKTTLLRDLTRLLSSRGFKIGLCDERSEVAGMYMGKPSYDLGPRTDVLDGCPKAQGMLMLIRAMSPDVIVTDEIGRAEDAEAIEAAVCAGVSILTTIHGKDYEDVLASPVGALASKGVFSRVIILTASPRTGTVREILHV